jgi:hypothetical protein
VRAIKSQLTPEAIYARALPLVHEEATLRRGLASAIAVRRGLVDQLRTLTEELKALRATHGVPQEPTTNVECALAPELVAVVLDATIEMLPEGAERAQLVALIPSFKDYMPTSQRGTKVDAVFREIVFPAVAAAED